MINQARLNLILDVIGSFKGIPPLPMHLKGFFRKNKRMGSTDRKTVAAMVYPYFRMGRMLNSEGIMERLAAGNFLCRDLPDELTSYCLKTYTKLDPADIPLPVRDKLEKVKAAFPSAETADLFPFTARISDNIDPKAFALSMLVPPWVWIRIRGGYNDLVREQINTAGFPVLAEAEEGRALAFAPATPLHILDAMVRGFCEIQDLNSQRTGRFLDAAAGETWWDACAGAGGKSLLLARQGEVQLLLTDSRTNILANADKRLRRTGFKNYKLRTLDLLAGDLKGLTEGSFDGIVLDAPCTGSGTWSRTPGMVTFFEEHRIETFASMQKAMIEKLRPFLKKGKDLVYITCSVFREENEEVAFFAESVGFSRIQSEIFSGCSERADTLYAARLRRQ